MNEKIIITNTEIDLIDFDIEIKKDFYLMTNEDNGFQFLQNRINSIHTNLNKLYYVKKMRFYILEYVTKILFDNKPIIKDFYLTINLEDFIELLSYNFNFPNPKIRFSSGIVDKNEIGEPDFLGFIEYELNSNYEEEKYSLEEIMNNEELANKEFEEYQKDIKEIENNRKSFFQKYGQLALSQMEFVEDIQFIVFHLLDIEKWLLEIIKENKKSNNNILYNYKTKNELILLLNDMKEFFENYEILYNAFIKRDKPKKLISNLGRTELLVFLIALIKNGLFTESLLKEFNFYYKRNSVYHNLVLDNHSNLFNKLNWNDNIKPIISILKKHSLDVKFFSKRFASQYL